MKTLALLLLLYCPSTWCAIPFGGGKEGPAFIIIFYAVLLGLFLILSSPIIWYVRRLFRLKREQKREANHLPSLIFLASASALMTLALAQVSHVDTGIQLAIASLFPFIAFLISLFTLPQLPPGSAWRKGRWSCVILAFLIPVGVYFIHHVEISNAPVSFVDDGIDFIKRVAQRPFCQHATAEEIGSRWVPIEKISPWRRESRWPVGLLAFRNLEHDLELQVMVYGCQENRLTLTVRYPTPGDGEARLAEALNLIGDHSLALAIRNSPHKFPLDVTLDDGKKFHAERTKISGEQGKDEVWISLQP